MKHRNRIFAALLAICVMATFAPFVFAEDGTADKDTQDTVAAETTDTEETIEEPAEELAAEEATEPDEAVAPDAQEAPEENVTLKDKVINLMASGGETVSYTGKRVGSDAGETSIFTVTDSNGNTYTGACCEAMVNMGKSGTAKISNISNSSKIAKVVYYYGEIQGWWSGEAATKNAGSTIGVSNTDVTMRKLIQCFCQISQMGASNWYNTEVSEGGLSAGTADAIRDYWNDLDVSGITVPSGFEIFYANAGDGVQDFLMWRYVNTGYVKVVKVSGNTDITG